MIRRVMRWLFGTSYSDVPLGWLSPWHVWYAAVIVGVTVWLACRKRNDADRIIRVTAYAVPTLYIADFFLMPFATDDAVIQVSKLPFHICTLLAVLIPFVQFHRRLAVWKAAVAVLAVACAGMFLLYPGSVIGPFAPWCYVVTQSFSYHGAMLLWGVMTIASHAVTLSFSVLRRVSLVTVLAVVWAWFGNAAYTSDNMRFDWLMLRGWSLPFTLPPLVTTCLPFIVVAVVMGAGALVIAVSRWGKGR